MAQDRLLLHIQEMNTNIENRRVRIRELLRNHNWYFTENDNFILAFRGNAHQQGNTILLSSHIDSVFDDDEYVLNLDARGIIRGTLDNSITNGVVLSLLEDGLLNNFLIGFTNYEEDDMSGAYELANYIREQHLPVGLVVALDVTNDNWEADISLENYYNMPVNFYPVLFETIGQLEENNIRLRGIDEAEADEADAYAENDLKAFSACLPTRNDMHSADCYTTLDKLRRYKEALRIVLNTMYEYCRNDNP